MKAGKSVFLTGEPGSGKTYVVNKFTDLLKRRGFEVALTASTGIAATHIGGVTIHSFSGIGVADRLSDWEVDRIASTERIAKRILAAKVLVIDEVSMLAAHTLDLVDRVFREVLQNPSPFGGIQIIFVGDFFQLPPVSRGGKAVYAFDSKAWQELDPTVCYLTEQHRHDDRNFSALLSAIRSNSFDEGHHERISERYSSFEDAPKSAPKLFTHNADVDRINSDELAKLPGDAVSFTMYGKGRKSLLEQLKRGCLSPERLELKEGATVMFTKNSQQGRYVNGSLGIVQGFDEETGLPIVKLRGGNKIVADRAKWNIEENGTVKASIEQIPLRLAWAITVHKSQGMSLDEAIIDLTKAFEFGQGYVALSRVRRLSGLHLLGLNNRSLMVDPAVIAKDDEFRASSVRAELCIVDEPGPYDVGEDAKGFKPVRQKHPNAYRAWTKESDRELTEAFSKDKSIDALAARFGRKPGAIRSRLGKLKLY